MSRIGQMPIDKPKAVEVTVNGGIVEVKGPKGNMSRKLPRQIDVKVNDNIVNVELHKQKNLLKAIHGTYRALIANMVQGVNEGWKKQLELIGTGYRAEVRGKTLVLIVGYSHPVELDIPEGLQVIVEKNVVTVEGIDKELVGSFAAEIRRQRPPEPYKGKGIKYVDETIIRKAGKAAKAEG